MRRTFFIFGRFIDVCRAIKALFVFHATVKEFAICVLTGSNKIETL